MRDMTYSYVWHDSSICVTWHIHTCDMTHPYVWHDSFIGVTWLIHRECTQVTGHHDHIRDMSSTFLLIHMRDMTYSYVWHDSSIVSAHKSRDLTISFETCLQHFSHSLIRAQENARTRSNLSCASSMCEMRSFFAKEPLIIGLFLHDLIWVENWRCIQTCIVLHPCVKWGHFSQKSH